MKKIIIGLLLITSIILLSGCTYNNDSKKIDKLLRKNEIIHSEDEFIDEYSLTTKTEKEETNTHQYHIYEDTEGYYFAVEYIYNGKSENYSGILGGKEYYTIRIYDDIERIKCCEEEMEVVCIECAPGNKKTEYTIDGPYETYKVSKKRTLFFKTFKMED